MELNYAEKNARTTTMSRETWESVDEGMIGESAIYCWLAGFGSVVAAISVDSGTGNRRRIGRNLSSPPPGLLNPSPRMADRGDR